MKLSASLPAAAKVGGAGVLGGGGIAGAGLLVHDRMQKSKTESKENAREEQSYKLTGLDETLVSDSNATFSSEWEPNSPTGNTAVLKISATSSTDSTPLADGKWTCSIKGIVRSAGASSTNLSTGNFVKDQQANLFKNQLPSNKRGFVTSCARNRAGEVPAADGNWSSEIRVELALGSSDDANKYVFPTEAVTKIFAGTYTNPEGLQ